MLPKTPYELLAERLKAMADPNRIRIISLLVYGERTACQLNRDVKVTQPTLSHHMKILCGMGVVCCRRQGVRRLYSLNTDGLRSLAGHLLQVAAYADAQRRNPDSAADPPAPPAIFARQQDEQQMEELFQSINRAAQAAHKEQTL